VRKTWWMRSVFGLVFGLLFLTLSRAALVENVAVEEPVLDQHDAVQLGKAPQRFTGKDALTQSPQRLPEIDPRSRTSDVGQPNAQMALRSKTNGHIIAPVAADTEANDHRERGGYWWSQGYRPAAVGGLLALGGIFGGLCGAGELGCGNSHENGPPPGPPNPPGPPPHPPHPPVPPGPPPHPPVSPFH
jgi:hypothetical protein